MSYIGTCFSSARIALFDFRSYLLQKARPANQNNETVFLFSLFQYMLFEEIIRKTITMSSTKNLTEKQFPKLSTQDPYN